MIANLCGFVATTPFTRFSSNLWYHTLDIIGLDDLGYSFLPIQRTGTHCLQSSDIARGEQAEQD
jgi:hypothetical protein